MATEHSDLAALGPIGFIGAGAAGSALARAFAARGARIAAVSGRDPSHAEALAAVLPGETAATTLEGVVERGEMIFLAVPDDGIKQLARALPWRSGQAVAHLSGAQSAAALDAVRERGARPAALHPLMTFPRLPLDTPVEAILARLAGCTWALEAEDEEPAAALRRMVAALDGHVIALAPGDRVPYHIAAVLTSNYVVALLGAAARLWSGFGVPQEEALRAMLPLLRAAVESLETAGLPAALTGPVARGDVGTITAHLAWLAEQRGASPESAAVADAYVALARLAIPLARSKGTLTAEAAARLEALLRAAEAQASSSPTDAGQS